VTIIMSCSHPAVRTPKRVTVYAGIFNSLSKIISCLEPAITAADSFAIVTGETILVDIWCISSNVALLKRDISVIVLLLLAVDSLVLGIVIVITCVNSGVHIVLIHIAVLLIHPAILLRV